LLLFLNIFLLLYDLVCFHSQLIDYFTLAVKLVIIMLLFETVQSMGVLIPEIAEMIDSVAFTCHAPGHPPIQSLFIAL
jgi:hypothetical protein